MTLTIEDIKNQLSERGYRSAKNRNNILRILDKAEKPLTGVEIIERVAALNESKDNIAETTVYRNIEMLAKEGFIKVISLLEGHNRYELDRGDHHHHLVCTNCDKIVPVEMEEHLTETEHKLEKQHNFKITSHSLEFFGICSQCGAA